MKTYRELLELAANACEQPGVYQQWSDSRDNVSCGIAPNGAVGRLWWNPLTDDGDALRLAVKLELGITFCRKYVTACAESHAGVGISEHSKDRNVATRLAIVRAAAELGKKS